MTTSAGSLLTPERGPEGPHYLFPQCCIGYLFGGKTELCAMPLRYNLSVPALAKGRLERGTRLCGSPICSIPALAKRWLERGTRGHSSTLVKERSLNPVLSLSLLACAVFEPHGLRHYLKAHFLDPTFKGLYQANAFDTALLIPYFIVLILLAAYGMHRYQLVYLYYKHRKNRVTDPESHFEELPQVTIQLPIFNEQYVIDRLVDCVCKMEYPREKLQIQVLDDSTDETVDVARGVVERYAALGHNIVYIHRTNREGYKAGALDNGLHTATGEFVAIFDADFTPQPDWLMKVIHHFANPAIGMVQTRWAHLNRNYSFLTEVEAILLDGHFVLEHGGRSRAGVFFNFNGTAGMWRRKAIDDAGGWEHDTLTEDTDLSYRSQLAGWKFRYLQDVECPAELPIEMTAFKTQQARWAKGLIQCAKKDLPKLFRAKISGPREARGLVSPDRQPQLSADDRAQRAAAAGDGHPLLPGMVSDAVHRYPTISGVDVFHLQLLSRLAEGAVSGEVVSHVYFSAGADGAGHRAHAHQQQSCDRGAHRSSVGFCAHAEISRGQQRGQGRRREEVSQAPGLGAVD